MTCHSPVQESKFKLNGSENKMLPLTAYKNKKLPSSGFKKKLLLTGYEKKTC